MTEAQTPPRAPRRNKVAEDKARLRAEISGLANKVPEFVNAGGVQTTRRWVKVNERAQRVAGGGLMRLSKKKLDSLLCDMRGEVVVAHE